MRLFKYMGKMEGIFITVLAFIAVAYGGSCPDGYKKANLNIRNTDFYIYSALNLRHVRDTLKGAPKPKRYRADDMADVTLDIRAKIFRKVFIPSKFCLKTKCVSEIYLTLEGPWPKPFSSRDNEGNVVWTALGSPLAFQEKYILNPCDFTKTCFHNLGSLSSLRAKLKYDISCVHKCERLKVKDVKMKACTKE